MNMGWKLGYITSLDGARGPVGTTSVVEEVGEKYDEFAEVAKQSEYDGGWTSLEGVGKVGSALDSGLYSKLISGGWGAFSNGAGDRNSRLSTSVVPRRPFVFSWGKIMSELKSVWGSVGRK